MDADLTKALKEHLLWHGADLVGIGSVDRWKNAPEEVHPRVYMPDARNVISVGCAIPAGVCEIWGDFDQPGKTAGPYVVYGHLDGDLEVIRLNRLAAIFLEKRGHKTVVFTNSWFASIYRFAEMGYTFSDFSHRHAAVAAGLGELGFSGLLLTPEFGPRQRINSIITNAPLVPDKMYSGKNICDQKRCAQEFGQPCINSCPTEAMPKGELLTCQIGEHTYRYRHPHNILCLWSIAGLIKGSGGRTDIKPPDIPTWKDIINWIPLVLAREEQHMLDKQMVNTLPGGVFCGKCMHQCACEKLAAREQTG